MLNEHVVKFSSYVWKCLIVPSARGALIIILVNILQEQDKKVKWSHNVHRYVSLAWNFAEFSLRVFWRYLLLLVLLGGVEYLQCSSGVILGYKRENATLLQAIFWRKEGIYLKPFPVVGIKPMNIAYGMLAGCTPMYLI